MGADTAVTAFLRDVADAVGRLAEALDGQVAPASAPQAPAPDGKGRVPSDPAGLLSGHRQRQIVRLTGMRLVEGLTTAAISREIGYQQPNVHSTLRRLEGMSLVERIHLAEPQRWRLVRKYRDRDTSEEF